MAGRSQSVHRARASNMGSVGAPTAHDMPLNYLLGREIGRGAFGVVFEATDQRSGLRVAVKRLPLMNVAADDASIQGEIDLMKRLDHPNVVKYIDTVRTREYLYIVLELVEAGSLLSAIKKFGNLPERLCAVYVSQILRGLAYLALQGVVHRDLKAANVLVTKDGIGLSPVPHNKRNTEYVCYVKLSDFGVSIEGSAAKGGSGGIAGSPYWMAPEIIIMNGGSCASDIWSLGCTVMELLTGAPPYFELPSMAAMFHVVQDDRPPLPEAASPSLRDFLSRCFQKDPAFRAPAKELLVHPWITQHLLEAAIPEEGEGEEAEGEEGGGDAPAATGHGDAEFDDWDAEPPAVGAASSAPAASGAGLPQRAQQYMLMQPTAAARSTTPKKDKGDPAPAAPDVACSPIVAPTAAPSYAGSARARSRMRSRAAIDSSTILLAEASDEAAAPVPLAAAGSLALPAPGSSSSGVSAPPASAATASAAAPMSKAAKARAELQDRRAARHRHAAAASTGGGSRSGSATNSLENPGPMSGPSSVGSFDSTASQPNVQQQQPESSNSTTTAPAPADDSAAAAAAAASAQQRHAWDATRSATIRRTLRLFAEDHGDALQLDKHTLKMFGGSSGGTAAAGGPRASGPRASQGMLRSSALSRMAADDEAEGEELPAAAALQLQHKPTRAVVPVDAGIGAPAAAAAPLLPAAVVAAGPAETATVAALAAASNRRLPTEAPACDDDCSAATAAVPPVATAAAPVPTVAPTGPTGPRRVVVDKSGAVVGSQPYASSSRPLPRPPPPRNNPPAAAASSFQQSAGYVPAASLANAPAAPLAAAVPPARSRQPAVRLSDTSVGLSVAASAVAASSPAEPLVPVATRLTAAELKSRLAARLSEPAYIRLPAVPAINQLQRTSGSQYDAGGSSSAADDELAASDLLFQDAAASAPSARASTSGTGAKAEALRQQQSEVSHLIAALSSSLPPSLQQQQQQQQQARGGGAAAPVPAADAPAPAEQVVGACVRLQALLAPEAGPSSRALKAHFIRGHGGLALLDALSVVMRTVQQAQLAQPVVLRCGFSSGSPGAAAATAGAASGDGVGPGSLAVAVECLRLLNTLAVDSFVAATQKSAAAAASSAAAASAHTAESPVSFAVCEPVLETLYLLGVVPPVLFFCGAGFPTPLRLEAALFVSAMTRGEHGTRLLTACGGIHALVGLLVPSRMPPSLREALAPQPRNQASPLSVASSSSIGSPGTAASIGSGHSRVRCQTLLPAQSRDPALLSDYCSSTVDGSPSQQSSVGGTPEAAAAARAARLASLAEQWVTSEARLVSVTLDALGDILRLHRNAAAFDIAGPGKAPLPLPPPSSDDHDEDDGEDEDSDAFGQRSRRNSVDAAASGSSSSGGGGSLGFSHVIITANEIRRLFVKAGIALPLAAVFGATFLFVCTQATALHSSLAGLRQQLPASAAAASVSSPSAVPTPSPLYGYTHLPAGSPSLPSLPSLLSATSATATPPGVGGASASASGAPSLVHRSVVGGGVGGAALGRARSGERAPSAPLGSADDDDDDGSVSSGFMGLSLQPQQGGSGSASQHPTALASSSAASSSASSSLGEAIAALPVVSDALANLRRMASIVLWLAEGDGPMKVAVGGCRELVSCLLRVLRPAPYELLHAAAAYPPVVLMCLKALKLLSLEAAAVDVMDECGALGSLVPFLAREAMPGVAGPGGTAGAAATAAGSPLLRSKEVQNYILHVVFNLCRVSRARQTAAAAAGVIPLLMAVIASGSPLRTLALPVFCDLAHAGARARALLWEAGGVPVLVSLLEADFWRAHALNALGDWVTQESAEERARMQAVLVRPASQEALCALLGAPTLQQAAVAEAVLPQLLTLCDRCPRLARGLADRTGWMAHLCARVDRCAVPANGAPAASLPPGLAATASSSAAATVSAAAPPEPGSLVLGDDARVVKLLLALLRAMFESVRSLPLPQQQQQQQAAAEAGTATATGGLGLGARPHASGGGPREASAEAVRAWLLRWGLPTLVVRVASAAKASGRVMLLSVTDGLLGAFVAAVSAASVAAASAPAMSAPAASRL